MNLLKQNIEVNNQDIMPKVLLFVEFQELITNGRYQIPWYLSNDCYDLIKKCLTPNPKNRIKISSIRTHKWLNNLPSILPPSDHQIDDNILAEMLHVGIGNLNSKIISFFYDTRI